MVDLLNEQGAHFIIVDTEADNTEALKFFRKNGFGNPKEHVYLSLNIKQFYQRKRHRPKEKEQKKTLPGRKGTPVINRQSSFVSRIFPTHGMNPASNKMFWGKIMTLEPFDSTRLQTSRPDRTSVLQENEMLMSCRPIG